MNRLITVVFVLVIIGVAVVVATGFRRTAASGTPPASHAEAAIAVHAQGEAPHEQVAIVFYRDGKQQTTTATIRKLELEQAARENPTSAPGIGLALADVTADVASALGLPSGTAGAFVEDVEPFTPAASAGVKRGDVILEINHRPVHSRAEALRALSGFNSG